MVQAVFSLPAWAQLMQLAGAAGRVPDLRQAFGADPARFQRYALQAAGVFADLSKNLTDPDIDEALLALAEQTGVARLRDAMFAGEPINNTEGRAVLHTLLRVPKGMPPPTPALQGAVDQVLATRQAMLAFAESVRANPTITDVVNIGIGGSDLGPQMAVLALAEPGLTRQRFHFVSNVDGHELAATLQHLQPQNTLFLVASKTFTTAETLLNAHSARQWFLDQGGAVDAIGEHFVGLTTHIEAASQFGITTTFGFWDWVGGRYSLWSSIGLSLAIAIGAKGFESLLAGAHAMDEHFKHTPFQDNLPVRLALLDVWYRNFLGATSRCVAPYHSGLRRLPAYLQQLEMESNGKRVTREGQPLTVASSPVVWGEPGTNGQHAFFQMLHQGTDMIPVEFIGVKTPHHALPGHHTKLLAHMLAQSQALMQGKSDEGGHRDFPGNRPSTTLLLDELNPYTLGALIALYEHRVFVTGAIWGINSFDQWGVELGKALAGRIEAAFDDPSNGSEGWDPSTIALIQRLKP